MWPRADLAARRSTRTTRAPSAALRVARPTWKQVSKSGGLWAATLRRGGPHVRPRPARRSTSKRCVDAKWCHTGCVFGAKNSLITQLPRRAPSGSASRCGPSIEVAVGPPVQRAAVPLRRQRPRGPAATATVEIECKVLVLAAGAMGNAPILMRSRTTCRRCPSRSAATSASTATTSRRSSTTERKVRSVLGLPGYARLPQGQADHDDDLRLLGRPARATSSTARASRSRRSSCRR